MKKTFVLLMFALVAAGCVSGSPSKIPPPQAQPADIPPPTDLLTEPVNAPQPQA